jgi:hypothetical protein
VKKYHVNYSYLATGMEGRADKEDYGIHEANNMKEAMDMALRIKHPIDEPFGNSTVNEWIIGCLTAKEVKE